MKFPPMIESSQPISPSDVARHYDQLDRFYREIWGAHVHHGLWRTGRETSDEATRAMTDLVAAKAQLRPGMHVCDVGCGYGETSRILAREFGVHVTGLTISPTQQAYAESVKRPDDQLEFFVEDWQENKRPSDSFDALIAIESTEHMKDKALVFHEAARVLKVGGRLVVCAWLAGDPLKTWQQRHLIEPVCREGRLPAMGTEGEYRTWIEAAGFRLTGATDLSEQVSRTWPICAWRFMVGLLKRPSYLKFLLDPKHDNRVFALSLLRIWIAYRLGAMRYVLFTGKRLP